MKAIRFSTLQRDYGPIIQADHLTPEQVKKAAASGCLWTAYSVEKRGNPSLMGKKHIHGMFPVEYVVTQKPTKPDVDTVNGLARDPNAALFFQQPSTRDSKGNPLQVGDIVKFGGMKCKVIDITSCDDIELERCIDGVSWDLIESKHCTKIP